ncbi:hypothetical protein SAMN04487981_102469 [Streptomyces sp. cf386]|nr:hypothetical protein SAMN04487981_102469 [Streptomyces sp. cf386]
MTHKGGADLDPKGRSDVEIGSSCLASTENCSRTSRRSAAPGSRSTRGPGPGPGMEGPRLRLGRTVLGRVALPNPERTRRARGGGLCRSRESWRSPTRCWISGWCDRAPEGHMRTPHGDHSEGCCLPRSACSGTVPLSLEREGLVFPEIRGLEGVCRRRRQCCDRTVGCPFRSGEQRGRIDERSPFVPVPEGPAGRDWVQRGLTAWSSWRTGSRSVLASSRNPRVPRFRPRCR